MGRPPKSVLDHIADGTYRSDRHGDRVYAEPVGDIGEPPADLTPDAMRYWHDVASSQSDSLGQADRAVLEAASRAYAALVKEQKEYQNCFDDKDRAKATTTISTAAKTFLSFASRLGATPIDRQRLKGAPGDIPEDDLLSLRRETA